MIPYIILIAWLAGLIPFTVLYLRDEGYTLRPQPLRYALILIWPLPVLYHLCIKEEESI